MVPDRLSGPRAETEQRGRELEVSSVRRGVQRDPRREPGDARPRRPGQVSEHRRRHAAQRRREERRPVGAPRLQRHRAPDLGRNATRAVKSEETRGTGQIKHDVDSCKTSRQRHVTDVTRERQNSKFDATLTRRGSDR